MDDEDVRATRGIPVKSDEIVSKVLEILKREFPTLRSPTLALGPDTPLLSAGLLDSFAVVTLLATLEETLGIDLDVEAIPFERLETAATIAALCAEALQSRSGAAPRT